MTIDVRTIESIYWQRKRGSFGEIVKEIDDINQCIGTILMTRKGSVPHNPELGSEIWEEIDQPINIAKPNIVRKAYEALEYQEPRIDLLDVYCYEIEANIFVRVDWGFKDSQEIISKEVKVK